MYSSGHLDWLAVTYSASHVFNDTLPPVLCQSDWKLQGRGRYGYRHMFQNGIGASILAAGDERQGIHLVLTGDTLDRIRACSSLTEHSLMEHILSQDGSVSRLDIAIDVYDTSLTPAAMAKAYENHELKTQAKKGRLITGINDDNEGFTLGSRISERYMRIYDKRAEQHIMDGPSWLRLEMELKRLRARGLATVLATENNTRGVINKAIGDYMSIPNSKTLEEVLRDQTGDIPQEHRKIHSTYKWLMDVVAPSVARYQQEHPDEDVMEAFITAVRLAMSRYEGTPK